MKRYFNLISKEKQIQNRKKEVGKQQNVSSEPNEEILDDPPCIPVPVISKEDKAIHKNIPSNANQEMNLDNSDTKSCSSDNSDNGDEENSLRIKPKLKYMQKPRDAWKKDKHLKDWIILNGEILSCKYCHVTIKNTKYCYLKDHAKTKKHLAASEPFSSNRQKKIYFEKNTLPEVHESEARTCLFVAKHTSINTIDHLSKVMKKNFHDSKIGANVMLSRTKCTAILTNVWYPFFKMQLVNDMQDNPFSLLIDESTDVSVVKYLGVVVKYYSTSENTCKTSLLKLQPLDACDADAIVQAILTVLKEFNLKMENLSGIGTDNASVMVGSRNGVFSKLKELNPKLILIPCVCHSIQLAISSASKDFIPKTVEFMVSETYNWFSRSSSRQFSYETLYKLINDGHKPLKITQSCQTRWLSIESAVTRIHQQYVELKTYFAITERTENSFKITSLSDIYSKEINYAYLCFFKPILQDLQRVNKIFESDKIDFVKVLGDLELLILVLIKKVAKPNSDYDFKADVDISNCELQAKPYLGIECEEKLHDLEMKSEVSKEEVSLFRKNCRSFMVKLIKELQQRVPSNLNILKQIIMLSVDECLSQNKSSLKPVLEEMNVEPVLRDNILSQWNNLFLVRWKNIKETVPFWCEVLSYKDASGENPFQDLAKFAISILVLPISNAAVERIFSQLNLVKTKQRNRMQLLLTNSILTIRNNLQDKKTCCTNFEIPEEIIKKVGKNTIYQNIEMEAIESNDTDSEDCI